MRPSLEKRIGDERAHMQRTGGGGGEEADVGGGGGGHAVSMDVVTGAVLLSLGGLGNSGKYRVGR